MSDVAATARRLNEKYLRQMYHIRDEDSPTKKGRPKIFCPNCSSYIPIGEKKCLRCGFIPSEYKDLQVANATDDSTTGNL